MSPHSVEDRPVAIGLWGKLPSRGDFVRLGLPRSFTDPWDAWMSERLAESQDALGPAWRDLWMVAPIWRFCLGAGLCGEAAVLGVWMPSVDSAGRAYPLTLAACSAGHGAAADAWLDAAEDAGLAALAEQLEPAGVMARLAAPAASRLPEVFGSTWWKADPGAQTHRSEGLPHAALFQQMIA